ncbi:MAG: hypothetical protein QW544_04185, partial [Candidatus Caldarchaeum sp.]
MGWSFCLGHRSGYSRLFDNRPVLEKYGETTFTAAETVETITRTVTGKATTTVYTTTTAFREATTIVVVTVTVKPPARETCHRLPQHNNH